MKPDVFKIYRPISECRSCGAKSWRCVKVLGAVGFACENCAAGVAREVSEHNRRVDAQNRADAFSGKLVVLQIPRPEYDPKPEPAWLLAARLADLGRRIDAAKGGLV